MKGSPICKACLAECDVCQDLDRDLTRLRQVKGSKVREGLADHVNHCPLGPFYPKNPASNFYPEFQKGREKSPVFAQRRPADIGRMTRETKERGRVFRKDAFLEERAELQKTIRRIERRIDKIEASLEDHAEEIEKERNELELLGRPNNSWLDSTSTKEIYSTLRASPRNLATSPQRTRGTKSQRNGLKPGMDQRTSYRDRKEQIPHENTGELSQRKTCGAQKTESVADEGGRALSSTKRQFMGTEKGDSVPKNQKTEDKKGKRDLNLSSNTKRMKTQIFQVSSGPSFFGIKANIEYLTFKLPFTFDFQSLHQSKEDRCEAQTPR